MIRVLIILVSFLFINFSSYANDVSKKCKELFENENYNLALPYCLKSPKGNEFNLGYMYGKKSNCLLSHKWYKKSSYPYAKINMSINLMYGSGGCKKDLSKAKTYLLQVNDKVDTCEKWDKKVNCLNWVKSKFGHEIANLYLAKIEMIKKNISVPNSKSFKYLVKAIAKSSYSTTEWEGDRLTEVRELLQNHLKNIKQSNLQSKIDYIIDIFDDEESFSMGNETMEGFLYENNEIFINKNRKPYLFNEFIKKNYFHGLEARMYDLGVGEIEDKSKALRIYFQEAKRGSLYVLKWKDNLKNDLSTKEINEAKCLAKRTLLGEEPNWIDNLMC